MPHEPWAATKGNNVTDWKEGQKVRLMSGGEQIAERTIDQIRKNGVVITSSGGRFRKDGTGIQFPNMRIAPMENAPNGDEENNE